MKIMVFDVPAETGGALSVLEEQYKKAKEDKSNEYIFVVSIAKLDTTRNIKILSFPWIKKSWFHRIYFDYFVAPNLLKNHSVDRVFSLQNLIIPRTAIYQSLFVHNALPFSDIKFGISNQKKLWVYQNVIGKLILNSIKRANNVIVQTEWMKKEINEKVEIKKGNIEVERPSIDIQVRKKFKETSDSLSTFFYPASGEVFKNHKVIVEAAQLLKNDNFIDYKIIFTLDGNENKMICDLSKLIVDNDLPIEFVGSLSRAEVFEFYTQSILIFPSYIETVGLPLLEAKMHGAPIIVADLPYSRELLKLDEVDYFECNSPEKLASILKRYLLKVRR